MHRGFWWESMQGRDHFEDLGLHGRINIKMHLKRNRPGVFNLSRDEDEWWTVVNMVMELWVP